MPKISEYPLASAVADTDELVANQGGTTRKLTRTQFLTGYLAPQDTVSGAYTFVQSDSGREKVFTGAAPATWTIPALGGGRHAVVHNIGTGAITFAASGVTLKGATTLAADKTAAVSWLPSNVVKLTGELS